MKSLLSLTAIVVVSFACAAESSAAIVYASNRGSTNGGSFFAGNGSNSAFNARVNDYRNFFLFNVSSYNNVWVTSTQLRLRNGVTNYSGTKYLNLRDFNYGNHSNAGAAFSDAGSGASYNNPTAFGGSNSASVFNFNLNSLGTTALQNQLLAGGTNWFGLGGSLSGAPTGAYAFGGTTNTPDAYLNINTVNNSGPVADSVDKTIRLENGVTLDASGSFDNNAVYGDYITSYRWDVNNDGTFDVTSTASTLTLSKSQLLSFGIGYGSNTIRLRTYDRWNAFSETTSNLNVEPVPEPATIAIWGVIGLGGVGLIHRRRKASKAKK